MDSLIYSLNATLPVFLVMAIAWGLQKLGMFTEDFITVVNRFNFRVTLPILLFREISEMDFASLMDPRFMLFCFFGTAACMAVIWLFSLWYVKDRCMLGSFIQSSYRGSAAVLGVAFVQNIYGSAGMVPLMIISCVPLYNVFAVIVLTLYSNKQVDGRAQMKKALWGIVTNPIILGILAGLPFSIWSLSLPPIVEKTMANFAAMSTPLALVAIGASFTWSKALKKAAPTIVSGCIKLVAQPLLLLPVAVALGFRGQALVAILIMLGSPTTPSCYIMAENMGNDSVLASGTIVFTTLFSAVTITTFLFVMHSMGLL
ncbi:MAG: AEC family transporter [Eubacteriales bacterium]